MGVCVKEIWTHLPFGSEEEEFMDQVFFSQQMRVPLQGSWKSVDGRSELG